MDCSEIFTVLEIKGRIFDLFVFHLSSPQADPTVT